MSTVKTNNVQIGQSLTASQNFTWYQPASPDGTVRLGNGNAGSVTDLVTVGSTGNLTFANSISLSAASTKTLTLNGGAGSNGLVIDASNNVGIGYNTPGAYRVYVKSTDTAVWAANTSQSQIISYNAGGANNACSTMEYQVVYGDSTVGGVKIGAVASASYSGDFVIANRNNGTYQENLRLTYSGNLGLGVTPSTTWTGAAKVLQISGFTSLFGYANTVMRMASNAVFTPSNETYGISASATYYQQYGGQHTWFRSTDASPIAGNVIAWSPAMTLDASGNLGIGQTSVVNRLDVLSSGSYSAVVDMTTAQMRLKHSTFPVQLYAGLDHVNRFAYMQASETGVGYRDLLLQPAGGNLLVGTTSAAQRLTVKGTAVGALSLLFNASSAVMVEVNGSNTINGVDGTPNANGLMRVWRDSGNTRSISAAGTINASGADYAEYMTKAGDFEIAKGDICGIDSSGLLTNVFADAISFVVKSTDPSYVGGDSWGAGIEDKDVLEIERQKVDRIAFAGQVPVNVLGAKAGDYIIPVADKKGIKGAAVSNPTFEQYQIAVGKVIAIEADGRARIIVKVT